MQYINSQSRLSKLILVYSRQWWKRLNQNTIYYCLTMAPNTQETYQLHAYKNLQQNADGKIMYQTACVN